MQLRAHARVLAIELAVAAEADVAAEPPVRQDRAEGVAAAADQLGDIPRPVIDPLVVVGPARGEIVIADAVTVQVHIHEAERSGVERGAGEGFVAAELLPKVGRRGKKGASELEIAPRLRTVVPHRANSGPTRCIKGACHPIVTRLVSGFPCIASDVPEDLTVLQGDNQAGHQPGVTRFGVLHQAANLVPPRPELAAISAFLAWRQLSFAGSVVSRRWALMANFIASSAEAHTSACFTLASGGSVN